MKKDVVIEILKAEFERKKSRNSAYSLRSFSRDLAIDPSNLSKILNYRKEVGPELRAKLAQKAGLTEDDLLNFSDSAIKTQDQHYKLHSLDAFQLVADWQHYAILELFKLKDFSESTKEISRRLGLSAAEIRSCLGRLEAAGLLEKTADGKHSPTDDSSSSTLNVSTSKAHREQQKQILEGAIQALEKTPIENRSQSSMTFAIDTTKLDEARQLIKKFRRQLGRLLSTSENLNEVYQLSISLYPVTQEKNQ